MPMKPAPHRHQLDLFHKPSGRTALVLSSGFVFDLLKPDAHDLPIEDIARALASQPRWGGACRPWYSVAEHCVLTSCLVPRDYAYDALMHDSHEFLGDWPTPVKHVLGRDKVKKLLRPIEEALAAEFRFRLDLAIVKQADLVCMATELRDLLPPHWMDWGHLPEPAAHLISPVGPERAYDLFLETYQALRAT